VGEEIKAQRKKADNEEDDHAVRESQADITGAQKAVTERVYHIEDGIHLGYLLPELSQQMN
jgi:hypothetical protein